MSFIDVDKNRCDGSATCVKACSYGAISVINGKANIDTNRCVMCRACLRACPLNAISIAQVNKNVDLSGYKGIWVIVEYFNDQIRNTGFQLISKANKLAKASGDKVTAVLVGNKSSSEDKLKRVFAEYGVRNIKVLLDENYNHFITEDAADVISKQIRAHNPKIVLFLGTIWGRSIAPQVATRVKTGLTADCTELEIDEKKNLLQIRPTFGGKVLATIETPNNCPQMASVRPNVFVEEKKPIDPARVKVEFVTPKKRSAVSLNELKKVLKIEEGDGELSTPLDEAKIVFCAGYGVGSKEGFKIVEEFAKESGASVAATRTVVDEGWADVSKQIGQTGVAVRPEIYVAFGVSGAIHHLIGMKNSRKIIAINKDPRAPIFKIADYGIVADLFEVIEKMKQRKDYLSQRAG
jgi:electron transfer flavoprotein alpha subunit/NAD-dependent dihydropyrimidine dehydrogenase PreA subunit